MANARYVNKEGKPLRGTIVQALNNTCTRQVVRRNLFQLAFNEVSRFNLSRRMRRAMARDMAHRAFMKRG